METNFTDPKTKTCDLHSTQEPSVYMQKLRENSIRAVNHICDSIDEDGYMRAATDYLWYRFMWYRDSCFTASALSYASKVLSDFNDPGSVRASERAREGSSKILGKLWDTIDLRMPAIKNALQLEFGDQELKKLKNHITARFGPDGNPVRAVINDKVIDDTPELENVNSWQKQLDSAPLVLFATAEHVKNLGAESLSPKTLSAISRDMNDVVDYVIKNYKFPCAGPWEQHPEKLHSYTVAAAYAGLKSAIRMYGALGGEERRIEEMRKVIYRNDYDGIIYFLNNMFVKGRIMHKFRREFSDSVEENPKVDAASYIAFALFDDGELFDEGVKSATLQELAGNHLFKSADGKSVYVSKMPKRYDNDTYFGGGPWILLGAVEAYYYIKNGNASEAVAILDEIEKLIPADSFSLPEQEPIDEKFLNPNREGENDAVGKLPAQDLIWSSAEYLRACSALLEAMLTEEQSLILRK